MQSYAESYSSRSVLSARSMLSSASKKTKRFVRGCRSVLRASFRASDLIKSEADLDAAVQEFISVDVLRGVPTSAGPATREMDTIIKNGTTNSLNIKNGPINSENILDLPKELLVKIISYAMVPEDEQKRSALQGKIREMFYHTRRADQMDTPKAIRESNTQLGSTTTNSLATLLVCRRFHDAGIVVLYGTTRIWLKHLEAYYASTQIWFEGVRDLDNVANFGTIRRRCIRHIVVRLQDGLIVEAEDNPFALLPSLHSVRFELLTTDQTTQRRIEAKIAEGQWSCGPIVLFAYPDAVETVDEIARITTTDILYYNGQS